MRTGIVNLDRIITGSLTEPFAPGDGIGDGDRPIEGSGRWNAKPSPIPSPVQ